MPTLKANLLESFYDRSLVTEQDFASRCGLSRGALRKASQPSNVSETTIIAIAGGMGLLPHEATLLCQGDNTHTVDELLQLSLRRLGLGLWGVCDHNFVRTTRYTALLNEWEGEHIQALPHPDGGDREVVTAIRGRICAAGRALGGEFTVSVNVPGVITHVAELRVEGYFFSDNHLIAIYRFADTAMPNYGALQLTLSLCCRRLDGTFRGWGNPLNQWVNGGVRLRRVD